MRLPSKKHKYSAKKCIIDGIKFDSLAEGRHYSELKLRERAGEISDIEVHPEFKIEINGMPVCKVIADFRYWDIKGETKRVEDVKGMDTALSKLKRKLVMACFGVYIEIIRKGERR